MLYGSETREQQARNDLALFGLVVISVCYYNIYSVPLWVTTCTLIAYILFIRQPTLRVCVCSHLSYFMKRDRREE